MRSCALKGPDHFKMLTCTDKDKENCQLYLKHHKFSLIPRLSLGLGMRLYIKYVLVVNGGHEMLLNSIHGFFLLFFVHGAEERVSGEPFSGGLRETNKKSQHSKQTIVGRVPFPCCMQRNGVTYLCIEKFLAGEGAKCNFK